MMQETAEKTIHRRLQRAAREYKKKGYEVVLAPSRSDIPDFLADFNVQMLARQNGENVVVEVRTRRSTAQPCLRDIAAAVENRPNWRLDIIMTNPPLAFPMDAEADLMSEQQVRDRLSQAETLLQGGYTEAALLLAWSAAEVILRRLAHRAKVRLQTPQPELWMKTLVYEGVLDRRDYEPCKQALAFRNLLIHGYNAPPMDTNLVALLVQTVSRLAGGRNRENREPPDAPFA